MLLKRFGGSTIILLFVYCAVIQCESAAAYKSEVTITPAPPVEEATTKKSGGFFSGIKNFFGGSDTTTTTVAPVVLVSHKNLNNGPAPASNQNAQKPPPLVIQPAPLQPLGPRPDTPITSPWDGNSNQAPQWPQPGSKVTPQPGSTGSVSPNQAPQWPQPGSNTPTQPSASATGTKTPQQQPQGPQPAAGSHGPTPTTPLGPNVPRPGVGQPHISQTQLSHNNQNNLNRPGGLQPNMPPGFGSYQPPKAQPSGFDLSYGGGSRPVHPPGRPGTATNISPMVPIATPSTSTVPPMPIGIDLRGNMDPKHPQQFPMLPTPQSPKPKEEFPALPAPKSPTPAPTPASPNRPSSPSAWDKPLPTPAAVPGHPTGTTPKTLTSNVPPASPTGPGGNRVSFVPHTGPTSTRRPNTQSSTSSNSLASDAEIESLTENLYMKENSNLLPLISVSAQGKTRSIDSADEAPNPLLDVNSKAFDNPTVAKMRLLFNNYEPDTLTNEHVTPNERKEENDFLDAVMATNVMRQAMLFLQNKGIVGPDPKTHRDMVKELWFTQYSRGSGKIGSSGFEHVFVNEVKNGTIIGLHNWVYFFDEEKAGHLDYKGYLKQLDIGNKAKVLKVRFTHNGLNKPVNTLFIGTSPELELALYTVCFKLRPDTTCPVSLGNSKFGVVTYSWRYRGKNLIGSAFPEI